jgi:hypothetical protein
LEKELETRYCIHIDTFGEALVGHVDEGNQIPRLDDFHHILPLVVAEVGAGGVVATGMKHNDRSGRGVIQTFLHAGKIHAAGGCVIVGVIAHLKTGGLEQGAMVFPARIADQHSG